MATKKSVVKPATATNPDSRTLQFRMEEYGITKEMNRSQMLAALATRSAQSAATFKAYTDAGKELEVTDLIAEMRKAGDEVVGGDLGRIERMLVNQAMTLDAIFIKLAELASRHEHLKQLETYLRLALKAQAQARATAESLAMLKNPQPYIRQANIANGHQQVNNMCSSASAHSGITSLNTDLTLENTPSPAIQPRGEINSFVPSKLLDA